MRRAPLLLAALLVALPTGLASCRAPRPPHYARIEAEDGFAIQDIVVPEQGPRVAAGDDVTIDYAGWLMSGERFDSSYDRGQPITFTVGTGIVPTGLDRGVVGMRRGGRRCLVVPPALGYGDTGIPGAIPPRTTLIFDVELVELAQAAAADAGEPDSAGEPADADGPDSAGEPDSADE